MFAFSTDARFLMLPLCARLWAGAEDPRMTRTQTFPQVNKYTVCDKHPKSRAWGLGREG